MTDAAWERLQEHLATTALGGDHPLMVVVPRDALKDLLALHEQLQARVGVLLSFARPVDIQAAERFVAEHGLVDAEGRRLT